MKCSKCGKSGHNKRTCAKKKRHKKNPERKKRVKKKAKKKAKKRKGSASAADLKKALVKLFENYDSDFADYADEFLKIDGDRLDFYAEGSQIVNYLEGLPSQVAKIVKKHGFKARPDEGIWGWHFIPSRSRRRNATAWAPHMDSPFESEGPATSLETSMTEHFLGPMRRRRRNTWNRRRRRRRFNPAVESPGNFRPVTSAQTSQFLDDWKRQGVTTARDFRGFEGSPKERKLDEIRFGEAKYNWDKHLRSGEPLHYPVGDDFGDYMPISSGAAKQYLHQFHTRQTQRLSEGLGLQDVSKYPFKPRYDEAVTTLGGDEADALEARIFDRQGYVPGGALKDWPRRMPFRRRRHRRNPWRRY